MPRIRRTRVLLLWAKIKLLMLFVVRLHISLLPVHRQNHVFFTRGELCSFVGFYPDNDFKRDTAPRLQNSSIGVLIAAGGCRSYFPARAMRLFGCCDTRTSCQWFERSPLVLHLALNLILYTNQYFKQNIPSPVLVISDGDCWSHLLHERCDCSGASNPVPTVMIEIFYVRAPFYTLPHSLGRPVLQA